MNPRQHLAIIGSGASAIYLLKHLLDEAGLFGRHFGTISIFEKSGITGMGMPYNPRMTDRFNMSNISSEELPELPDTFGDWLRAQDPALLEELGVEDEEISDSEVYSRLALGRYLNAQYRTLVGGLVDVGIEIHEFSGCEVVDVRCVSPAGGVVLETAAGESHPCDRIVIATGHSWIGEDKPAAGYYTSPWPMTKLLPAEGEYHDFAIGTLGASLSAFDVISSLAHRHGKFAEESGTLCFHPFPGTENFKISMHSAQGLLPHLQFDQDEPFREIYRHVDREGLLALVDDEGFLRLETYFDRVCRPALIKAFAKDGMTEMVGLLGDPQFGFAEFVKKMTDEHDYPNAFEGMRYEMIEARRSVLEHKPIHWKEVIDDLMYTLNFHAELMPAEDHLTLRSGVMPFLMNVIAAMPLGSGNLLLALYDAGKLDLVAGKVEVCEDQDHDGRTTISADEGEEKKEIVYPMFVDCSGQKPLELEDYPFQGLVRSGKVRRARVRFSDSAEVAGCVPEEKKVLLVQDGAAFYYHTGGVDVDAAYRLIATDGRPDPRLCDIAFPHTSGVRPYSYGLQACSDTSLILVKAWVEEFKSGEPVDGGVASMTEIYDDLAGE
ncbi:MAG: FAD/NAD(P)-binding protein [Verrucomicrobiota bacterium]